MDPDRDEVVKNAISHMPRWDISEVRHVLEYGAARVIDGTLCDLFSASLIVKVFDLLSDDNQAVAQRLTFAKFGDFCWDQTAPKGNS